MLIFWGVHVVNFTLPSPLRCIRKPCRMWSSGASRVNSVKRFCVGPVVRCPYGRMPGGETAGNGWGEGQGTWGGETDIEEFRMFR